MAVTLYKRKGSNVWHAQWVDPRGRRHQRSTRLTRRRDAEELAARWEREALRDPADVAREQAVFGDALDLLEEHLRASVAAGTMAEATALFHQAKATQLVRVFTNDRLLSTLGPAAVRDYCTARRAAKVPASDHTLVKELTTLRLALRLARERALWAGDLDAVQPLPRSSVRAEFRPYWDNWEVKARTTEFGGSANDAFFLPFFRKRDVVPLRGDA